MVFMVRYRGFLLVFVSDVCKLMFRLIAVLWTFEKVIRDCVVGNARAAKCFRYII